MEPSLQPSFTFPSRRVNANRAIGLQAQISLQQVTTVPKRATDISIETGLQSSLTVPKTLDKDVIDVKAMLPIATPMYVQPGQAEGLTQVAKWQKDWNTVGQILGANNALKRGNYQSAEHILGRPVTAQEVANKTITPNTRQDENNPALQTHIGPRANNIGSQVLPGNSFHQRRLNMRNVPSTFLYDLADHYGVTMPALKKLKTRFGIVDESLVDEQDYIRMQPNARRELLETFANELDAQNQRTKQDNNYDNMLRSQMEGEPSKARHIEENHNRTAQQYQRENPKSTPTTFEDAQAQAAWERWSSVPLPDDKDEDYDDIPLTPPPLQPVHPMVDEDEINPQARVFTQTSVPLTDAQNIIHSEGNPNRIVMVEPELDRMDDTMNDVDLETHHRVDLLESINQPIPTPTIYQGTSDTEMLSEEKVADAVLNAPAGSAAQEHQHTALTYDFDDILNEFKDLPTSEYNKAKKQIKAAKITNDRHFPEDRARHYNEVRASMRDRFGDHRPLMQQGGGIGRGGRGRGQGMDSVYHPYKRRSAKGHDDRWLPEADGVFQRGAPVSGDLMRRTGHDALPVSAQLQVQETHQWTETPVRRYTEFPNMLEEMKEERIPISQSSQRRRSLGVASKPRGKIPFGNYMIDHGKLMGEGILSLSHRNGRKVHGFPNTRLSAGSHHAVHKIVTGGAVDSSRLTGEDKIYMTSLLKRSHANTPKLGADVNVPPEQQLSLILGEIEAGNDSPSLLSQLRKILPYLQKKKLLTASHVADIRKHYLN